MPRTRVGHPRKPGVQKCMVTKPEPPKVVANKPEPATLVANKPHAATPVNPKASKNPKLSFGEVIEARLLYGSDSSGYVDEDDSRQSRV